MQLNIIHLPQRRDRWQILMKELYQQGIANYKVWDGILDTHNTAKGISKSHKQIVKYAKYNNLPEVLIAEDDLKFTDKEAFKFYLHRKPIDYDLYLGSIYLGELAQDNTVRDFSGLIFYTVNQRFYETFLSIPEHDNLDRLLRNTGKFIVCNPFTVIQHNGVSDNAKQYCNYDHYLEGRILFKNSLPNY